MSVVNVFISTCINLNGDKMRGVFSLQTAKISFLEQTGFLYGLGLGSRGGSRGQDPQKFISSTPLYTHAKIV